MANLQESRAKTLVREDENSLTESNILVSNLQAGTSLGHPISVLSNEFNTKQADRIEEITRTQYRESSNPTAKSNKESENLLANTNMTELIFKIHTLINLSMNEIAVVLNKYIGNNIIGIKLHFTKEVRTHLEIIFKSREDVQKYCTNGINIFNQTFLGYIPTNSRNSYLSIKLKNVLIDFQNDITKEICKTFDYMGKISSIKPLVFEGTSILSNQ
ncbi:8048_t:CDS:2 [Gigaspora margarita]|uniref:8048_t:CDS:1 n=1 Tax=Gigaspora margarita TaxID=4874 RepID=A0ABN7VB08_GIGMA|nr:8048_t:CDS:2 [Gigaspora margarita]